MKAEDRFERLIPELRQGKKKAFDQLFNLFSLRIYRLARKLNLDHQDAEEVVQDTFVSLWEQREGIDPSKDFKAYMLKIAKSHIIKTFKRKALYFAFEKYVMEMDKQSDHHPEHLIHYNELLEILEEEIRKLPAVRQEIFLLSRREYLSNEEIARKLGLSRRTVENQLYRALKLLKDRVHIQMTLFMALLLS